MGPEGLIRMKSSHNHCQSLMVIDYGVGRDDV
jgi:hypothetical protein